MKIEDGNLILELNDLWRELPADTKAEFLQDDGAWEIINQELLYLLGRSLSSPSFNNSIHKVRELILTNDEFVDNMLIEFIKTVLNEWANAKQDEYAARAAFWELYHHHKNCNPNDRCPINTPLDVLKQENEEWDYRPSVSVASIQNEILELFRPIVEEYGDEA